LQDPALHRQATILARANGKHSVDGPDAAPD